MTKPVCLFCRRSLDEEEHRTSAPREDGGLDYACDPCLDRIKRRTEEERTEQLRKERLRCETCGASWGSGCDCPENLRAIAAGERVKAREEEA